MFGKLYITSTKRSEHVKPSAGVSCNRANRQADTEYDYLSEDANCEGRTRSVQEARKDIPPQAVGTQPVFSTGVFRMAVSPGARSP